MHLNDESKWVRMTAFQILGPFISTFAEQFTDITYNEKGELEFTRQQDSGFRYEQASFAFSILLATFFPDMFHCFDFHCANGINGESMFSV